MDFDEIKKELMQKDIEELLRLRFYGSYIPGPIESAIFEKIRNMKAGDGPHNDR